MQRKIEPSRRAKFMGPTWDPPGSCRPQMDPMLAPWTLLSRLLYQCHTIFRTAQQRQNIRGPSLQVSSAHMIKFSGKPWEQGSWGKHLAHLGPTGPRWAPRRPHELCYLGRFDMDYMHYVKKLFIRYKMLIVNILHLKVYYCRTQSKITYMDG